MQLFTKKNKNKSKKTEYIFHFFVGGTFIGSINGGATRQVLMWASTAVFDRSPLHVFLSKIYEQIYIYYLHMNTIKRIFKWVTVGDTGASLLQAQWRPILSGSGFARPLDAVN
jgi:hypothetical protein